VTSLTPPNIDSKDSHGSTKKDYQLAPEQLLTNEYNQKPCNVTVVDENTMRNVAM
jgi:hypothetical protein